MTRPKILSCILFVIVVGWAVRSCQTPESDKHAEVPLDYSKPVYTIDRAIVCPLGLLFDVRADYGPEAIFDIFIFDKESKAEGIGCEVWQGGLRVNAIRIEKKLGGAQGLSLVQINGTLFTAEVHLTNNGGPEPEKPVSPVRQSAQPIQPALNNSVAVFNGTELPQIHNSPDFPCIALGQGDSQAQCTDDQFVQVLGDLQRQWAMMPEWLRVKCVSNSTYPSMEKCIKDETNIWLNDNPNGDTPWVNPDNFVQRMPSRSLGGTP